MINRPSEQETRKEEMMCWMCSMRALSAASVCSCRRGLSLCGRDLSGNKRTNKKQSFDQTFEKMNEALRVSCKKGYPVRVVRSHKEKRSSYAPQSGVRYDGVYRIEKCWRKVGIQGFKVCRYLFVRCDNEPAPWTSDEHGDRPRPLPVIKELANAIDMAERKGSPAWDFDEQDACWKWKIPPPPSRKPVVTGNPLDKKRSRAIRKAQKMNLREKLLNEFSCTICKKVMADPVTTPCAHNFCKLCLEGAFAGKSVMRNRSKGGRTLRAQKNIMQCPRCPTDISDFLQNPQVNRDVMEVIEKLQKEIEKEAADSVEEDTDISEENSSAAEDMETEEDAAVADKSKPPAKKSPRASKKKKEDPKRNEKNKNKPARANKRRKVADEKTGEAGNQDSATDGNESPSSPLNIRSSDDDFE